MKPVKSSKLKVKSGSKKPVVSEVERLNILLKRRTSRIKCLEEIAAEQRSSINHLGGEVVKKNNKIKELETALRTVNQIDFDNGIKVMNRLIQLLPSQDEHQAIRNFAGFVRLFQNIPIKEIKVERLVSNHQSMYTPEITTMCHGLRATVEILLPIKNS